MDEIAGLDVRDYQLYLLHTLGEGLPALLAAGLEVLGADADEAWAAYERISGLKVLADPETGRVNPVAARVTGILGEAVRESSETVEGQVLLARDYALPVWPGFLYRVVSRSDGLIHDEYFLRDPGTEAKSWGSPSELQPWNATREEVAAAFGPLTAGDVWPPFEEYAFSYQDDQGIARRAVAVFHFRLLTELTSGGSEP